jgi:hypothetical protein
LCRLSGEEISLPKKVEGICLFEQDLKKLFFLCHYDHIWSYLYNNYSNKYSDVQELIKNWLDEVSKINLYTLSENRIKGIDLEEESKIIHII